MWGRGVGTGQFEEEAFIFPVEDDGVAGEEAGADSGGKMLREADRVVGVDGIEGEVVVSEVEELGGVLEGVGSGGDREVEIAGGIDDAGEGLGLIDGGDDGGAAVPVDEGEGEEEGVGGGGGVVGGGGGDTEGFCGVIDTEVGDIFEGGATEDDIGVGVVLGGGMWGRDGVACEGAEAAVCDGEVEDGEFEDEVFEADTLGEAGVAWDIEEDVVGVFAVWGCDEGVVEEGCEVIAGPVDAGGGIEEEGEGGIGTGLSGEDWVAGKFSRKEGGEDVSFRADAVGVLVVGAEWGMVGGDSVTEAGIFCGGEEGVIGGGVEGLLGWECGGGAGGEEEGSDGDEAGGHGGEWVKRWMAARSWRAATGAL